MSNFEKSPQNVPSKDGDKEDPLVRVSKEFKRLEKTETGYFQLGFEAYGEMLRQSQKGQSHEFSEDKVPGRLKESILRYLARYNNIAYGASHFFRAIGVIDRAHEENSGESLLYAPQIIFAERLVGEAHGLSPDEMNTLLSLEPVFNRNVPGQKQVKLSDEILRGLPREFSKDPSYYIEKSPNVKREVETANPSPKIGELTAFPYDWARIKKIGTYVFKRVDSLRVHSALEEPEMGNRIRQLLLRDEGVTSSRIETPHFVGYVMDRGNIYIVSEYIDGLEPLPQQTESQRILDYVASKKLPIDFYLRNIRVTNGRQARAEHRPRYFLLDFETIDPLQVAQESLREAYGKISPQQPQSLKGEEKVGDFHPREKEVANSVKNAPEVLEPTTVSEDTVKDTISERERQVLDHSADELSRVIPGETVVAKPLTLRELKEANRRAMGFGLPLTEEERKRGLPAGKKKKAMKQEKISAAEFLKTKNKPTLLGELKEFFKKEK